MLTGLRIVATVRCAPPANKPTTEEKARRARRGSTETWRSRRRRLRSMLALGSIGWDAALAQRPPSRWPVPRPKPRFGHGAEAVLSPATGRPVRLVGSYHVSQQNTFTGKLTEAMLDEVIARL